MSAPAATAAAMSAQRGPGWARGGPEIPLWAVLPPPSQASPLPLPGPTTHRVSRQQGPESARVRPWCPLQL